jgi:hypothetical protein
MTVFGAFWYVDAMNFEEVNGALMVLLPKTPDASAIKDYRLISLMHVIGKLFSKVLANHLATPLREKVHTSQCAFIKGRFIHDNLDLSKLLHLKRKLSLLLKVDIAQDSMSCPFLIKVLNHLGFPLRWADWLSVLLSMASTKVMLNESPA